jgi:hypothetical protein
MAAFFSFTHIGPVGIFDDGLQKTATTVGPNLVTPVGFRPYASGLAWTQHSPAIRPPRMCRQHVGGLLISPPASTIDATGIAAPPCTWTIILSCQTGHNRYGAAGDRGPSPHERNRKEISRRGGAPPEAAARISSRRRPPDLWWRTGQDSLAWASTTRDGDPVAAARTSR